MFNGTQERAISRVLGFFALRQTSAAVVHAVYSFPGAPMVRSYRWNPLRTRVAQTHVVAGCSLCAQDEPTECTWRPAFATNATPFAPSKLGRGG